MSNRESQWNASSLALFFGWLVWAAGLAVSSYRNIDLALNTLPASATILSIVFVACLDFGFIAVTFWLKYREASENEFALLVITAIVVFGLMIVSNIMDGIWHMSNTETVWQTTPDWMRAVYQFGILPFPLLMTGIWTLRHMMEKPDPVTAARRMLDRAIREAEAQQILDSIPEVVSQHAKAKTESLVQAVMQVTPPLASKNGLAKTKVSP